MTDEYVEYGKSTTESEVTVVDQLDLHVTTLEH